MNALSPTSATAVSHRTLLHRQLLGSICVVFTALGWGLNWPATKLLIASCPPLSARGVAGLGASAILFFVARLRNESLQVRHEDRWRLVAGALLNVTFWMGGTTASLKWLRAGQATTLAYTMPIWVCLLAWPALNERPSVRQIVAMTFGICGILVLLNGEGVSFDRSDGPGIALALLAALSFAIGTVYGKARPIALTPIALTAWQVGLGSVPLLVFGFAFEDADFRHLPVLGWAALGYTALISMGLCYVTWFTAKGLLSASGAAIGTLLTPVIGVGASAVALGDPLTLNQVASLALVIAGIVLAIRTEPSAQA